MDYIPLLAASIVIFTIQTICIKVFNYTFMKNLSSFFLFHAIYLGVVVVILAIVNVKLEPVHIQTVLLAISFGSVFIGAMLMYMKAMEIGALSYTTLINSFGLLMPIIFGLFLWKEKMGLFQVADLILLFFTFYLASKSQGGGQHNINLKWLLLCIVAMVLNGGLMVLSKEQQVLLPGKEIEEFLMIAFCTASLLSILLFLRSRIINKERVGHLKSKKFLFLTLVCGLASAAGYYTGLYVSNIVPAVIQFPTVCGGIVTLWLFAILSG